MICRIKAALCGLMPSNSIELIAAAMCGEGWLLFIVPEQKNVPGYQIRYITNGYITITLCKLFFFISC